MNREGLGISSDLSREMRARHGLVVSCEEKFSARVDPKLWIAEKWHRRPASEIAWKMRGPLPTSFLSKVSST
jgi:hypothetical protein